MNNTNKPELDFFVAVDVGNTCAKFGVFSGDRSRIFPVEVWRNDPAAVSRFFDDENRLQWVVSSVNSTNMEKVIDWIVRNRPLDPITIMAHEQIPIHSVVDNPMRTGLDRLLAALGAINWTKTEISVTHETQPVLVCDFGTAITIDLATLDGVYHGGSILPGFELAAAALSDKTELLSKVNVFDVADLSYPAKNTKSSIAVGIIWGVVGAIRLFAEQFGHEKLPYILLNGFGSDRIALELRKYFPVDHVFCVDNLVLAGIRGAVRQ